ncbi:SDR family NAD(P)-dependent oxidoreductase [Pseudonocardia sp. CA-107938]|uniref:SDR family NAD(P)-dependent oxidoreductase n=1 Tax=Pseudonocardia sp. CA-107938 TaxID=3240021 RepID=UPI003D90EBA3
MAELAGRAAIVTGAGAGIGRAIGQALAAQGAFVWVTDADAAGAAETAAGIEQAGGRAEAVRLDVSEEAAWEAALSRCDAATDALTVLVNCAGTARVTDTFSMPLADFRRIMSVNVEGTFLGMKHAIPRIADNGGGAVVNISSIAGLKGMARWTAYCGSKGAIRMMTKAVALECAQLRNGVRVNSVHPGFVDTPSLRAAIAGGHRADPARGSVPADLDEVAKTAVPIGVACSPDEVAATVCFLASAGARHITGAEIVVDGGMTAG